MRQWDVNNLPKVVAQQRHGRGSNLRPLDRKSDTLPLIATPSAEVEQNKCVGVAIATFDVWKRTMDRNNHKLSWFSTDHVGVLLPKNKKIPKNTNGWLAITAPAGLLVFTVGR